MLVSLGKDGMFYSGEAGAMRLTVPSLTVKSAVGAGDSLTAGFIAGYQAGLDWIDCLRQACAFGSAACLVDGTNPQRGGCKADSPAGAGVSPGCAVIKSRGSGLFSGLFL